MTNDTRRHYDLLIAENNDPVLDPPALSAYMDGWDGPAFLALLALTGIENVLEIGMGTGRLTLRVAPHCMHLTGIDLSAASVARAAQHLAPFHNVDLRCGDFLTCTFHRSFDLIYSSLTMLHIREKDAAVRKIATLLSPGGRVVLSLDKSRETELVYGDRTLPVYPDDPKHVAELMQSAGLTVQSIVEIEHAWLLKAVKQGGFP